MKRLQITIEGVRPLLMHSAQLADPRNEFAKALKKYSSKRPKTDADFEAMAEIEFKGGLWIHDGSPCIPSHVLEAVAVEGAKKSKDGKLAKAGVFVPDSAPLEYDGPRDPDELWKSDSFVLTVGVRVQMNRVMRTRPHFPEWSATFTVHHDEGQASAEDVIKWYTAAGHVVGIGDWRPKFGAFEVVDYSELND